MKKSNMKSINKQTKSMLITYAMVIAVFIIVEIMISTGMMSSLMQGLLVPLCIYSIVAIGLNLCVGYLGELSLGHAGFMCVGAFSSAVFSKCMMTSGMNETLRFILALLIGTVVAAVFGWLIGIPVLRLRGDYLAIVTLAFGEIIKNVINVMYLGRDGKGFHFSIKDSASLNMQADGKMIIDGAKAYLVNTGWNGTGKRISIKDTRGIIDAILNGDILNAPTKKIPYFNFEVPTELPGVDSGILDPRDTYADASEWEEKAKDLAARFVKNFAKYEGNAAGKALVSAGPQA